MNKILMTTAVLLSINTFAANDSKIDYKASFSKQSYCRALFKTGATLTVQSDKSLIKGGNIKYLSFAPNIDVTTDGKLEADGMLIGELKTLPDCNDKSQDKLTSEVELYEGSEVAIEVRQKSASYCREYSSGVVFPTTKKVKETVYPIDFQVNGHTLSRSKFTQTSGGCGINLPFASLAEKAVTKLVGTIIYLGTR